MVESSGTIHFQEGLTADGADLVRARREGSTRLAVHHHQIQNLGQDPHLLVAFIATPRVPAMGAGVQAEWVACLKSEGSDWVSFSSRCSPRPAATHASEVLFLIGCVAHAPGQLTQMLRKSSQQAPPVWIRSREQISIAVGRQVLGSRGRRFFGASRGTASRTLAPRATRRAGSLVSQSRHHVSAAAPLILSPISLWRLIAPMCMTQPWLRSRMRSHPLSRYA